MKIFIQNSRFGIVTIKWNNFKKSGSATERLVIRCWAAAPQIELKLLNNVTAFLMYVELKSIPLL